MTAADLVRTDQEHLIHPLHHPVDSANTTIYVRGRGAIIEDIATGPKDYIFWKERWDPFQGTNFEACLRLSGIDTLIANGGATSVGIASTAYGAHRLDFDLVVVSDGCYHGIADEEHEVFLNEIFPGMGRVRTADQVMAMLRASAR